MANVCDRNNDLFAFALIFIAFLTGGVSTVLIYFYQSAQFDIPSVPAVR
jgi:hypothetical protein